MLYIAMLTVFLPALVWDTRRVFWGVPDCFFLCFCKEDSRCCCCGYCLSNKQKLYSGIQPTRVLPENQAKLAQLNYKESSCTERCLAKCFAPCILSPIGKCLIVLLYGILIAGSLHGIQNMKMEFRSEYLIDEDSVVHSFYEKSD